MEWLGAATVLATLAAVVARPRGVPEWVVVPVGVAVLAVAGQVAWGPAGEVVVDTLPTVAFLLAVTVLGRAAEAAGVFDVLAAGAARLAGDSATRLLGGVVVVALVTTTLLSLDATVVLLTPAVVVVARRTGAPTVPLALAVVHVANAGSLLLPVSNLTNLLVADRLGGALHHAGRMLLPQAVAMLCLWGVLRWQHRGVLAPPLAPTAAAPVGHAGPALPAVVACLAALVPALLLTDGWALAAAIVGVTAAALVATRRVPVDRSRWGWVPWRLGVFVVSLFVLVGSAAAGPLGRAATAALGDGTDPWRVGLVGAAAANLLNNLPAFLLLEGRVGDGAPLRALLVGVDLGPNLLTVGSLATLLWLAVLRQHDAAPTAWQFLRWGLVVVPATLVPTLAVVALLGQPVG